MGAVAVWAPEQWTTSVGRKSSSALSGFATGSGYKRNNAIIVQTATLPGCMRDYELTRLSSASVTVCLRRRASLLTGSWTVFLCVLSLTTAGEGWRWRGGMAAELLAKSPAARAVTK